MHITRRHLFNTTGLGAVALLAGCNGSTMTPQQIVDDASNAIAALAGSLQAVLHVSPGAIPQDKLATINAALAAATSVLKGLSTSLTATAAAPVVRQVEDAINTVVTVAASIPLIPPPFSVALAAASVVLPILEAFVNQFLPAPASVSVKTMAARAKFAGSMSKAEAEATLAAMARQ